MRDRCNSAMTGYYRATENPVHTTVWPDARIYCIRDADRGRAGGVEARADVNSLARHGITGYVNYALGRVDFKNPVTGGFVTEAEHLSDTNWFSGAHGPGAHAHCGRDVSSCSASGVWTGLSVEYGSGTPIGHGGAHHDHGAWRGGSRGRR